MKTSGRENMNNWTRITSFEPSHKKSETWIFNNGNTEKKHAVDVTFGKPVNILSLKLNMAEDYTAHVAQVKNSRTTLFSANDLDHLTGCPICNHPAQLAQEIFSVYGAPYFQCPSCAHYFIKSRPSKKALEHFYSADKSYQMTYADPRTTETRVQQVATPKVKWMIEQYEKEFGTKPKRILDVGAGSGHFVYACRQLGLHAEGVEISESGRDFSKNVLEVELHNIDFIAEFDKLEAIYDVITFWGVIEHVPNPMEMLAAAYKLMGKHDGLVIAEVPRWDCLGSSLQAQFTDSIVRHLDPLGHINCFTDSSLATAFQHNKFNIVSAWYFGMDMYELITQLSYLRKDDSIIEELKRIIPTMQQDIERARFSDEMVIAGRPFIS